MLANRLCYHAAARPQALVAAGGLGLRTPRLVSPHARRVFVSTPWHRKDASRIGAVESAKVAKIVVDESVKPDSATPEKPADPTTPGGPLLSEQVVSSKEQRKADWRIIKDMSHYLWPKDDMGVRFRVGLSVAFLVGAKVCEPVSTASILLLIVLCRFSMFKFHSTSKTLSTR